LFSASGLYPVNWSVLYQSFRPSPNTINSPYHHSLGNAPFSSAFITSGSRSGPSSGLSSFCLPILSFSLSPALHPHREDTQLNRLPTFVILASVRMP